MKSIKTKIVLSLLLVVFFAIAILAIVTTYTSYTGIISTLSDNMESTAFIASSRVESELNGYKDLVKQFSMDPIIVGNYTPEEINAHARSLSDTFGFLSVQRTNKDGLILGTDISIADRGYFTNTKSVMTATMSNLLTSRDLNQLIFAIAAPITKGGKFDGIVFCQISPQGLCDVVANINIGTTGSGYIIDNAGFTIAHKDISLLENKDNSVEAAKTDPGLKELAALETEMAKGMSGFGEYTYGGVTKYLTYAPIKNTNGWSVGINAMKDEFMGPVYSSILAAVICFAAIALIAVIVALKLGSTIANPIIKCVKRLELLSQGNLSAEVPIIKSNDETRLLADSTAETVMRLNGVVSDISGLLSAMADGNFAVECDKEYSGDFAPLTVAIRTIISSLNMTLQEIRVSSEQVYGGSEQVSQGSQSLAQGATEQASSIEELSATIADISTQLAANAENARTAKNLSVETETEVANGSKQMTQMIAAMGEISTASSEIGKIIKTIDDIAFQTNILALNAAVEAARAGNAGKGFAVVADEVRNLASKSASAAKDTTALIQGSIDAVANGTAIADKTAHSLAIIVEKSNEVNRLIGAIASANIEEASSINEINMGVEQISAVVQTNSATAQESAAASEELSGQASSLQSLVAKFRLK